MILNWGSFQGRCGWSENYTNLSTFKWDRIQIHFFMCEISSLKRWLSQHYMFYSFLVFVKFWGKENNPNSCVQVSFWHLIFTPIILIWKPDTQKSLEPLKKIWWNIVVVVVFSRLRKPSERHNQTLDEGNLIFSQVFLSVTKDKLSL